MTQPPDEPRPPDEPATEPTPDTAPTVAWSQPSEAPAAYGSSPTPANSGGWEIPDLPPPMPAAVASEGWQLPGAGPQQPVLLRDGYVAGSTGSRIVAWLIDTLLVAIAPAILLFIVFDWRSLFQQMSDQIQVDAQGRLIPNYAASYSIPITPDLVLVYLIAVGIQFLYFVGFWTSRWQATPGMVGLKLRVVDQTTGAGLTVGQATKRWIALGYPLGLGILVPALQYATGPASLAVNAFVLLSTATDRRKQGFHDKFAKSQVIRHISSGSGATVLGCFAYGIMLIVAWIAAVVILFAVAGPSLVDYARSLPRYTP